MNETAFASIIQGLWDGERAFTAPELHVVFERSPSLSRLASALADEGLAVVQLGRQDCLADLVTYLQPITGGKAEKLDAIHIYSHGSGDGVQLGRDLVTGKNIDVYKSDLRKLGDALSPQGDLLLYGCDLASTEDGRSLLSKIADASDADLRASDDITGSALLGGDWHLEYESGDVQAQPLSGVDVDWTGVLKANSNVKRSIILSAFGDAAGTYGESLPFISALVNKVDRTDEAIYAKAVVEGELFGQPVTIVVTGTGGGNAGPAMQEMLSWYGPDIKEVIWSGIGGVTPAKGGYYNKKGEFLDNPEMMIGDTCIGIAAWSWDLHFSNVNDWASANKIPKNIYSPRNGWWQMLDADGKQVAPGFDNIQDYVVADSALADELLIAAKSVDRPVRPDSVTSKIARFHPDPQSWREPKYYSYTKFGGEVSGDNFWHGATEDLLARKYMSSLMRASGINPQAKAKNIAVFSAMEAVPWMSAVQRWDQKHGTETPMVVIRSASNYDQVPLRPNGQPILNSKGKPLTAIKDINIGFDDFSSAYAASIAAAPVLRMFELREEN